MIRNTLKRMVGLPLIALLTACGAGGSAPDMANNDRATATAIRMTPTRTAAVLPTVEPTSSSEVPSSTVEPGDLPDVSVSLENAHPTPVAAVRQPAPAAQPARIVIPAIDLDLATVAVGVDEQHIPIVPKHEPGWFTSSAVPGQGTNIVLWGHVLRWQDSPTVPAPFARLEELDPGAVLSVVTADGKEWSYRVTQQLRVRPHDVQLIAPTLTERVTLVSCIGDKVIQNGTLTKEFRLVTVAEPVR